jgi:hypothetical protein
MKRFFAASTATLALAACGDVTPPAEGNSQIRMVNKGSERLKTLSPIYQRITLYRAIRSSGKRCGRIERLGYQQEYEQLAMWVALCDDGRHWAVFIAPNDDIQVRDCSQHAQLGLPVCRPLPPLPRDPNAPPNSEPSNSSTANLL